MRPPGPSTRDVVYLEGNAPAHGIGAPVQSRRPNHCFREKPKYHKCACRSPNDHHPVNSPNFLPYNHLRTTTACLICAFPRQSTGAEIPFLRAKIPFPAPPIARIPPNERAPAKFLWCTSTPTPARELPETRPPREPASATAMASPPSGPPLWLRSFIRLAVESTLSERNAGSKREAIRDTRRGRRPVRARPYVSGGRRGAGCSRRAGDV